MRDDRPDLGLAEVSQGDIFFHRRGLNSITPEPGGWPVLFLRYPAIPEG